MDKAILTKNQSKSLEYALKRSVPKEILTAHLSDQDGWLDEAKYINELEFDTLAKALYNGYDIEHTSEEKLVEHYEKFYQKFMETTDQQERMYYTGVRHGIELTTQLLGIEINGIFPK